MLNLMSCQPVDRYPVLPPGPMRGPGAERPDVAEPIHVHVRVREYGGSALGTPAASLPKPDLGRMPVGMLLDCYV